MENDLPIISAETTSQFENSLLSSNEEIGKNEAEELTLNVQSLTRRLNEVTDLVVENIKLKQSISDLSKQIRKLKAKLRSQNIQWQRKCNRRHRIIKKLKQKPSEGKVQKILTSSGTNILSVQKNPKMNSSVVETIIKAYAGEPLPWKYEPAVRKFAVTTHFHSPRAYRFIREQLGNCLPHEKTLARWYSSIDGAPGFTQEALKMLKLRAVAAASSNPPSKLICSLVFDEMNIRQQTEFDGTYYHGFVDMGPEVTFDVKSIATQVLVFMVVAINGSWKVPVGYFFIDSLNAEQKASLISQCLDLIKQCGISVANITFDGCPANLSMSSKLGCSLKPDNLKPTLGGYETNILPDPSHMIKLIRNAFGDKRQFIDSSNEFVDFKYVEMLNKLQENEGLHLANKLRKKHILFFKQK